MAKAAAIAGGGNQIAGPPILLKTAGLITAGTGGGRNANDRGRETSRRIAKGRITAEEESVRGNGMTQPVESAVGRNEGEGDLATRIAIAENRAPTDRAYLILNI